MDVVPPRECLRITGEPYPQQDPQRVALDGGTSVGLEGNDESNDEIQR